MTLWSSEHGRIESPGPWVRAVEATEVDSPVQSTRRKQCQDAVRKKTLVAILPQSSDQATSFLSLIVVFFPTQGFDTLEFSEMDCSSDPGIRYLPAPTVFFQFGGCQYAAH